MSLSAYAKELKALGLSDAKIIEALCLRDDERLAKGRARTARSRNTQPANVTLQASRDVTSVTKPKLLINNESSDVTSVSLARVVDNLLTIEDTGKKDISAPASPRMELEAVLDGEHAQAVIDHRQRLRSPLTAHAAKLLAKRFSETADPNGAADEMIERGWRGFKGKWTNESHANGRSRDPADEMYGPKPDPKKLIYTGAKVGRDLQ